MPTTGDLALYTPAIDEQGWGDEMNDNLEEIDQAITQRSSPVGTVAMTARSSAPSGWLLCQGQAISRVTYSALFSAISTTWGVGDGATTFNIPDLRGRAPIGVGTGSGLTNRVIATNYGSETHVLSTSEIPAHSHGITDPGHTHSVREDAIGATEGAFEHINFSNATAHTTVSDGHSLVAATTGVTVNNAGGGGGHANIQPSVGINFMIKT
jgi:microcystin-dependent protein